MQMYEEPTDTDTDTLEEGKYWTLLLGEESKYSSHSGSFGGQVMVFHYRYASLPPSRELKSRLNNHRHHCTTALHAQQNNSIKIYSIH